MTRKIEIKVLLIGGAKTGKRTRLCEWCPEFSHEEALKEVPVPGEDGEWALSDEKILEATRTLPESLFPEKTEEEDSEVILRLHTTPVGFFERYKNQDPGEKLVEFLTRLAEREFPDPEAKVGSAYDVVICSSKDQETLQQLGPFLDRISSWSDKVSVLYSSAQAHQDLLQFWSDCPPLVRLFGGSCFLFEDLTGPSHEGETVLRKAVATASTPHFKILERITADEAKEIWSSLWPRSYLARVHVLMSSEFFQRGMSPIKNAVFRSEMLFKFIVRSALKRPTLSQWKLVTIDGAPARFWKDLSVANLRELCPVKEDLNSGQPATEGDEVSGGSTPVVVKVENIFLGARVRKNSVWDPSWGTEDIHPRAHPATGQVVGWSDADGGIHHNLEGRSDLSEIEQQLLESYKSSLQWPMIALVVWDEVPTGTQPVVAAYRVGFADEFWLEHPDVAAVPNEVIQDTVTSPAPSGSIPAETEDEHPLVSESERRAEKTDIPQASQYEVLSAPPPQPSEVLSGLPSEEVVNAQWQVTHEEKETREQVQRSWNMVFDDIRKQFYRELHELHEGFAYDSKEMVKREASSRGALEVQEQFSRQTLERLIRGRQIRIRKEAKEKKSIMVSAGSNTSTTNYFHHPHLLEVTISAAVGLTHRKPPLAKIIRLQSSSSRAASPGGGQGKMRRPQVHFYLSTRVLKEQTTEEEEEEEAGLQQQSTFVSEVLIGKHAANVCNPTLNPRWSVKDSSFLLLSAKADSILDEKVLQEFLRFHPSPSKDAGGVVIPPFNSKQEVRLKFVVFDLVLAQISSSSSEDKIGSVNLSEESLRARPDYYAEGYLQLSHIPSNPGKSFERLVKLTDESHTVSDKSDLADIRAAGGSGKCGSLKIVLNTSERSSLIESDFPSGRVTNASHDGSSSSSPSRVSNQPNIVYSTGSPMPSPIRQADDDVSRPRARPSTAQGHYSSSQTTDQERRGRASSAQGKYTPSTSQSLLAASRLSATTSSRPASASQSKAAKKEEDKQLAIRRKKSEQDSHEIYTFFQDQGLGWAAEKLLKADFTCATLEKLQQSDLEKLRITNKQDQQKILGLVILFRSRPSAASKSQLIPHARGELADGTVAEIAQNDGSTSLFTATTSTANECARKATVFMSHHKVSKNWPFPKSDLSKVLNLSNAALPTGTGQQHLYDISIDNKDDSAVQLKVKVPKKHQHGHSAKFCHTCQDHVIADSTPGSWQYQQMEKILIGDGVYDQVHVWKPFHKNESLKIEYALKRKKPKVPIRGKHVDFKAMLWGGDKPVRRVERDAIPFPTLKPNQIVTAPPPKAVIPEEKKFEIDKKMADLNFTLNMANEKKNRLALEQEQDRQVSIILAKIHAMMLDYFAQQRADLEEEEFYARQLIEGPDYEDALDKLFDWEEASVRDVALAEVRRESEKVTQEQCAMMEEMEEYGRHDIEAQEEAARQNLMTLLGQLNKQCRDIMAEAKKDEAKREWQAANRNKKGGPGDELRCPVCRKQDCPFFRKPWKNHWKHHHEKIGEMKFHEAEKPQTLSGLMAEANEKEYNEYLSTKKEQTRSRKLREHMMKYITGGPSADPNIGSSPQKLTEGPCDVEQQGTPAGKSQMLHNTSNQIPPVTPPAWQPASTTSKASRARDMAFATREAELQAKHQKSLNQSGVQAQYKLEPPFVPYGNGGAATAADESSGPSTTMDFNNTDLTREEGAGHTSAMLGAGGVRKRPPSAGTKRPAWGAGNGATYRPPTPQKIQRPASAVGKRSTTPSGESSFVEERTRDVSPSAGRDKSSRSLTTPTKKSQEGPSRTSSPPQLRSAGRTRVRSPKAKVSVVVLAATDLNLPEGWTDPTITLTRMSSKEDPSMIEDKPSRTGADSPGVKVKTQGGKFAMLRSKVASARRETSDNEVHPQQRRQHVAKSSGVQGNKRTFLEAFTMQDVDLETDMVKVQCWAVAPPGYTSRNPAIVPPAQKSKTGAAVSAVAVSGHSATVLLAELNPSTLCFKDYLRLPSSTDAASVAIADITGGAPGPKCQGFFPMPYLPHLRPIVQGEGDLQFKKEDGSSDLPIPKLQLRMVASRIEEDS